MYLSSNADVIAANSARLRQFPVASVVQVLLSLVNRGWIHCKQGSGESDSANINVCQYTFIFARVFDDTYMYVLIVIFCIYTYLHTYIHRKDFKFLRSFINYSTAICLQL